ENAPLQEMRDCTWSHLRHFTLYGILQPPTHATHVPLIAVLARMPRLRYLHLRFSRHPSDMPQAIWPIYYDTTVEWPELEELLATHPVPEDQLWSHIPRILRSIYFPSCPSPWE
ncbi:uncharacterized protein BXZ73DRAFT_31331, partial [Epithele typhae]|uniref:uncharacterized protein n=1 Tax=Epithele typhae TaxID=378194 RepID=UPI002008B6CA